MTIGVVSDTHDHLRNVARFVELLCDPPLELVWAERRILAVHDPRDLATLETEILSF